MKQREILHSRGKTHAAVSSIVAFDAKTALKNLANTVMATLARFSIGRILLHLVALLGDQCTRFHVAGIVRELSLIPAKKVLDVQARKRLIRAVGQYLARTVDNSIPDRSTDPHSLVAILNRGDVLLSQGNTRMAAMVKSITRSPWSHVFMYVGPLEDGPDPRCIVEADIVAGVHAVRLSELNALQVRVLRPIGLNIAELRNLAGWVVSRIGSEYDMRHAWEIGRKLLRLPLPSRPQPLSATTTSSTTRFICCSLLAQAFALAGSPILSGQSGTNAPATPDHSNLTPGDFEHASIFKKIGPPRNFP